MAIAFLSLPRLPRLPPPEVMARIITAAGRQLIQLPKKLVHPVILGSVLLHTALLFLPMPHAQPEPKKEVKREVVKITKLSAARPRPATRPTTARPKPKARAKPRRSRPKAARPRPKLSVPKPKPKPKPKPVATAKPAAKPSTKPSPKGAAGQPPSDGAPTPTPTPKPTPTPSDRPTPSPSPTGRTTGDADKAGDDLVNKLSDQIVKELVASGANNEATVRAYMTSIPIEGIKADQVAAFVAADGNLHPKAFGSLAIQQMSATTAYETYIQPILTQSMQFKIESLGSIYGGAELYKAKNDSGVELFFSMVSLKFNAGAFMVLWEKNPADATPP